MLDELPHGMQVGLGPHVPETMREPLEARFEGNVGVLSGQHPDEIPAHGR
jgi:hypothetical protein